MRFFGIWTILVALTISVVAAYYSIIGLVALFAAATIPVIIMGSVLEVGKITTAVWLHANWERASLFMKTYLVLAVLALMFITSMGIFGFLSKAHIEQTAIAYEGQAQLIKIEKEVNRLTDVIDGAKTEITKLESVGSEIDTGLQGKIIVEEARVQSTWERLAIDIQQEKDNLTEATSPYRNNQQGIDNELDYITRLQKSDDLKDTETLKKLVGVGYDWYGDKTAAAVLILRDKLNAQKQVEQGFINALISESAGEQARLRSIAEAAVEQSNNFINRIRDQIGIKTQDDVEDKVDILSVKIQSTEDSIDKLIETKYNIEIEARKLEADVGPVKYIAEVVYGESSSAATLEKAVRWVILILVFVFDPLAVVLVLAGITAVRSTMAPKPVVPFTPKPKRELPKMPKLKQFKKKEIKRVDKEPKVKVKKEVIDDLRSELEQYTEEELNEVVFNGMTRREYTEWQIEQFALNQIHKAWEKNEKNK